MDKYIYARYNGSHIRLKITCKVMKNINHSIGFLVCENRYIYKHFLSMSYAKNRYIVYSVRQLLNSGDGCHEFSSVCDTFRSNVPQTGYLIHVMCDALELAPRWMSHGTRCILASHTCKLWRITKAKQVTKQPRYLVYDKLVHFSPRISGTCVRSVSKMK